MFSKNVLFWIEERLLNLEMNLLLINVLLFFVDINILILSCCESNLSVWLIVLFLDLLFIMIVVVLSWIVLLSIWNFWFNVFVFCISVLGFLKVFLVIWYNNVCCL